MGNNQQSYRHRKEESKKDQFHHIRQWLNIIFMLGAIMGVAVYLLHTPQTTGVMIILAAMIFKIIECILRFIK